MLRFTRQGILSNGSCVAVKNIGMSYSRISTEAFVDEITATMKAKHKNIVRFIGYCAEGKGEHVEFNGKYVIAETQRRLICLEYMPAGTLQTFLLDVSRGLEFDRRYQIMKEICKGLHYLHEKAGIVHLDMKPENILLDNNSMPKLFDFGLSYCLDEDKPVVVRSQITGTMGYIAPENIAEGEISTKSDMYSFGVIVRKLFLGLEATNDNISTEQVDAYQKEILEKEGAYSWENIRPRFQICMSIASKCTDSDPSERPSALEIIQLLDECESMNCSVSSDHTPICQDTEPKETPSDHLPNLEEPGTAADTDAHASAKQDKQDLVTPLHEKLSSLDFLKGITDGFSEKRVIGKGGASGFVYQGVISDGGMVIAVKRLCALPIPEENFVGGTEKLMTLEHDNVLKLLGYCHDSSDKQKLVIYGERNLFLSGPEQLLCYEYLPKGSLHDYLITGQGTHQVDWQMRFKIMKGISEGLHYLHEGCVNSPIVYLNLSMSNVLLDGNNSPRISDTGVSWLIGEKDNKIMATTMKRPIGYMAPEYFQYQGGKLKFPTKADIYSLGVMILEIITGQENRDGKLAKTVKEIWMKNSHIQSVYDPSLQEMDILEQVKLCIDIGLQCVNVDHNKRPTAGDIIRWLNQGHMSVPRASLPVSTTKTTHADDHMRGTEGSSNTSTAAPVTETKPGFWNRHGRKK